MCIKNKDHRAIFHANTKKYQMELPQQDVCDIIWCSYFAVDCPKPHICTSQEQTLITQRYGYKLDETIKMYTVI